jgi:hypothetical protein
MECNVKKTRKKKEKTDPRKVLKDILKKTRNTPGFLVFVLSVVIFAPPASPAPPFPLSAMSPSSVKNISAKGARLRRCIALHGLDGRGFL